MKIIGLVVVKTNRNLIIKHFSAVNAQMQPKFQKPLRSVFKYFRRPDVDRGSSNPGIQSRKFSNIFSLTFVVAITKDSRKAMLT